jgi:predicted ester cyclase
MQNYETMLHYCRVMTNNISCPDYYAVFMLNKWLNNINFKVKTILTHLKFIVYNCTGVNIAHQIIPFRITHNDTISKNDKVLVRWTVTGTVKKELLGIPASDKPLTLVGFDLFRIANGKIVEMWQQFSVGRWS